MFNPFRVVMYFCFDFIFVESLLESSIIFSFSNLTAKNANLPAAGRVMSRKLDIRQSVPIAIGIIIQNSSNFPSLQYSLTCPPKPWRRRVNYVSTYSFTLSKKYQTPYFLFKKPIIESRSNVS